MNEGKERNVTDDLSVFWQNNDTAAALFYDLLARMQREAYDDEFLAQLAAYRTAGGDAVHADVFAAQYLLANDDAERAVLCAERAYAARPVSPAVWTVLARAYAALHRYADALVLQGCLARLCGVPLALDLPRATLDATTLDRLSAAMSHPSHAPLAARMQCGADGHLTQAGSLFLKEFLPVSPHIMPPYYVGVHAPQGMQGAKAWQIDTLRDAPGIDYFGAGDFTFDLIRGQLVHGSADVRLAPQEEAALPILGTVRPHLTQAQKLHIRSGTTEGTVWLNEAVPNFFRLDADTTFTSDEDFIVGTPIRLGHSPARKRLVLNILVDALPWQVLREHFAAEMPKTHRFFQRGTIFDRNYSVAEYTFPSFAAIETGMYPHRNGIFHDQLALELDPDTLTIAEHMRDLGYAATQLMSDGNGIYNGVTRGYDRIIVNPYRLSAYEGVERAIRYLEGLGAGDHFIHIHVGDVHPWPAPIFQCAESVQAQLPLAARIVSEEPVASPYMRPSPLNHRVFRESVRDVDRALGTLFDYLVAHYAPEDYLVNLYSDHGVAIFSEPHDIVGTGLTGATWMMRGAGVPEGVVTDELTSGVDLYPALGALCGFPAEENVDGILPKILGGTGREIAFSNSLYPGKPYFLAARSRTHTLRLETQESVGMDGTVDLAHANVTIYPRAHENEAGYAVDSAELRAFFYPRVREFLRGIGNNGESFPLPTKD